MDDRIVAKMLRDWAMRLLMESPGRPISMVAAELLDLRDILDPTKGQLDLTRETGPENSREEVTGQGGPGGKNSGYSGSGFGGGNPRRLAAAYAGDGRAVMAPEQDMLVG